MARFRFRLLGGQHIEADRSKPLKGPDGKPNGRFAKKVFKQGDVIDTDVDLASKLGPNKFELLGSESDVAKIAALEREIAELKAGQAHTPTSPATATAVFPGGQVSSGFQQTGAISPDGQQKSGLFTPAVDATTPPDDLDSFTVVQLREIASEEEIDLRGFTRKEDIVRVIRQSR